MTAAPKKVYATAKPKVPAFARYRGTSAWRKYKIRVREFNEYRAAHAPTHRHVAAA